MTITLHSYRRDGVSLEAALAKQPRQAAEVLQGYIITPSAFAFARYANGQLVTDCPIDQAYEARFFNPAVELRWLRDPDSTGEGAAVWLAEEKLDLNEWSETLLSSLVPMPDSRRLMTGTLAGPKNDRPGWMEMNAPRHGKVALPVEGDANARPCWKVREYLGNAPGTAGEDGNRMVVEERILGIVTVATEEKNNG